MTDERPLARPDFDALIAELEGVVILGDDPSGKELARRAIDALVAARERADQAETTARVNYGLYISATDDLNKAESELAEWGEWENEAASQMHPSWDGDEAQISILTAFIKHAAHLDTAVENARAADEWSGRQLTFVWDDDTRTLSASNIDEP